jgi:hypothetical protein
MGFGKHFLDKNMSARKLYHIFFGNLAIHTFGRTHGNEEAFFAMESF